jgi:transcriptional activator of cad operon
VSLIVGDWRVFPELNRIRRRSETRDLEPKVMDLLALLAARPGETVTREAMRAALWPEVLVGDDALARCVFKLRRRLGDEGRPSAYVETVSKRGYRLVAPVRRELAPTPSAGQVLIERARDAYGRYAQADNEMAAVLYRRVLAAEPGHAEALAGLAMTEVQRAVRWTVEAAPARLDVALADGRLDHPQARAALSRALVLAARAQAIAPDGVHVLQAVGLVRSAHGDLDGAEQAYRRALALTPEAPGALINLADVLTLKGEAEQALAALEQAYRRLTCSHDLATQRLGAWIGPLGLEIARRHRDQGRPAQAEAWLHRVLEDEPFHPGAAEALAELLGVAA